MTVAIDARLVGGRHTGDTTYWHGLLAGLARTSADVRFLLYSNAPRPEGIPDDPRMVWIPLPHRSPRWWSLVAFPLAARRAGANVIHTQYNLSPLAGKAGVTTVHDVSFFIGPQWFTAKDRFMLRRFVPRSCARAARVITVSETSKREIEQFIPRARGKVVVTPNALNPAIRPWQRDAAQAHVRDRLGIEGPFLLTVGTRWPRKNMRLAIDAARLLPPSLPHRLVVSGKPGWGDDGDLADPRIVATGYVEDDDLSALYSCADLYLAPSRHEGFGLPLLEAFACGCPVLCSTGGAMPEVAGDAAAIEPSWEPSAWAERIGNLLADSGTLGSMRERGYARLTRFDWQSTAAKTLSVYREVAS
ncbi:MAG TPA: glycosyltransferase family 1 protein [Fimbriimonadaceae bacterium]|nr:glycosyltransferase family 1 protein [Fimbriimonadaceae bacterium]